MNVISTVAIAITLLASLAIAPTPTNLIALAKSRYDAVHSLSPPHSPTDVDSLKSHLSDLIKPTPSLSAAAADFFDALLRYRLALRKSGRGAAEPIFVAARDALFAAFIGDLARQSGVQPAGNVHENVQFAKKSLQLINKGLRAVAEHPDDPKTAQVKELVRARYESTLIASLELHQAKHPDSVKLLQELLSIDCHFC